MRIILICIVLLCCITCGGCGMDQALSVQVIEESLTNGTDAGSGDRGLIGESGEASVQIIPETGSSIWVHVCGCVNAPGVYELPPDARGQDALTAAGGYTADADTQAWNLAAPLTDGMMIFVPAGKETDEDTFFLEYGIGTVSREDDRQAEAGAALVNINTADAAALMTLPGIGQTRAEAIVAFREKQCFSCKEDLMLVSGIGQASYDRLKDSICVR